MPFGLKKRTSTVPASDGRHILVSKAAVGLGVSLQYRVFLKEHQQAPEKLETSTATAARHKSNHLVEEVLYFRQKTSYLGHLIRQEQFKLSMAITAVIRELKDTTTQTELRSFLGFCNVFKLFAPKVSKVAALLNKKLGKVQPTSFPFFTLAIKDAAENLI